MKISTMVDRRNTVAEKPVNLFTLTFNCHGEIPGENDLISLFDFNSYNIKPDLIVLNL